MKWCGKYWRKVGWIVKWCGKYGRKVSWIVKRYKKNTEEKSVEMWNDMENMEEK